VVLIEIFEGQAKPYKGLVTIVDHEQRTRKTKKLVNNFPQFFAPLHKNWVDVILKKEKPYISSKEILFNTEFCLALTKRGEYLW